MNAINQLTNVKKKLNDWKLWYSNGLPVLELANKREFELWLKVVEDRADQKDEEIIALEELVDGVRTL